MRLAVLIFIVIVILMRTHEPEIIHSIRKKYEKLVKEFDMKPKNLTVIRGSSSELGYNIGKGFDIGFCVQGATENTIMHVLIHEIAHSLADEYEHGKDFKRNLQRVQKKAETMGMYKPVVNEKICGEYVSDYHE